MDKNAYFVWHCLVLQFPPANEETLALRQACLLNPLERPPKHCTDLFLPFLLLLCTCYYAVTVNNASE